MGQQSSDCSEAVGSLGHRLTDSLHDVSRSGPACCTASGAPSHSCLPAFCLQPDIQEEVPEGTVFYRGPVMAGASPTSSSHTADLGNL